MVTVIRAVWMRRIKLDVGIRPVDPDTAEDEPENGIFSSGRRLAVRNDGTWLALHGVVIKRVSGNKKVEGSTPLAGYDDKLRSRMSSVIRNNTLCLKLTFTHHFNPIFPRIS